MSRNDGSSETGRRKRSNLREQWANPEDDILVANVASRAGKFVPKRTREKPKVFKPEARDFIESVAREKAPDIYPALLLGPRAGLLIGEICALSWDDVDFDAGAITVRRTINKGNLGSPNSGRERVIAMSPE